MPIPARIHFSEASRCRQKCNTGFFRQPGVSTSRPRLNPPLPTGPLPLYHCLIFFLTLPPLILQTGPASNPACTRIYARRNCGEDFFLPGDALLRDEIECRTIGLLFSGTQQFYLNPCCLNLKNYRYRSNGYVAL